MGRCRLFGNYSTSNNIAEFVCVAICESSGFLVFLDCGNVICRLVGLLACWLTAISIYDESAQICLRAWSPLCRVPRFKTMCCSYRPKNGLDETKSDKQILVYSNCISGTFRRFSPTRGYRGGGHHEGPPVYEVIRTCARAKVQKI